MSLEALRNKLVLTTIVLLALSLTLVACRSATLDESKPFGLGGDSVVVGFTPTPTASHPPTAVPADGAGETPKPTAPPSDGGPDATAGRQVFSGSGCVACHTVEGLSSGSIGPELTNLASNAAGRVSGQSAEDYVRISILNPSAFVVDGFPAGIMPPGLVPEGPDLDNLVGFLLTLQ
jgi:cytochrome c551/c552